MPTSSPGVKENVGEQPIVQDTGEPTPVIVPVQQPAPDEQRPQSAEQAHPQNNQPKTELRRSNRKHNKPNRYEFQDL